MPLKELLELSTAAFEWPWGYWVTGNDSSPFIQHYPQARDEGFSFATIIAVQEVRRTDIYSETRLIGLGHILDIMDRSCARKVLKEGNNGP